MRAAPVPSRVTARPRQAAIQPTTAQPSRRLLDRRMGTPSSRHAAWLGRYQDWQWDAKRYARTIGVVRFAANLVASTAGRVNLIVEQRNADGDWVPTEDKSLRSLLAMYGNETFGQTANELVRLHTWHYQVAGEAIMVNRDDSQGSAEWLIASLDAVEFDKPQKELATIRFHPGGVVTDGTAIVLPRDQMMHYWMPDEEWLGLATSPMTSVMDDIRRYRSLVRYAQRQAESYLAMNGMLWSTEKPHTKPATGDLTEHEGVDPTAPTESTPFEMYNEWAQLSINDDDSIAAVLPPWLWFGEAGDKPELIELTGGLDEHGPEHRKEALEDFARGSDSPMSLIAGGGASDENHWGAWITQERFVAAVAPTLDRVTHQDMTVAVLYPMMRLMGRSDLRQTRIGYDATPVIVHPDMSDKALRAVLVGGIGYEALREAMGFTESDAPSPEDIKLLSQVLSNFAGGNAAPGTQPSIKAPGEKVGPGTVQETGPLQPQPSGTGTPLAKAAALDVLAEYLPQTVTVGHGEVHGGNGHTRTAASLNAGMDGVMLALPVPDAVKAQALPDGEPPDSMHMTLLYFGGVDEVDPQMLGTLRGICSAIAGNNDMPYIDLSHIERFTPAKQAAGMDMGDMGDKKNGDGGGMDMGKMCPCCMVDDGPDVPALVNQLKSACADAGVPYRDDHAFRSHVTLGYYPEGEGPEQGPLADPVAYSPDALMLHWGDEVHEFPFVDAPEPGALPLDEGPVLASSRMLAEARRSFIPWDPEDHPRDEHGRFTHGGDSDVRMEDTFGPVVMPTVEPHGTPTDRLRSINAVRAEIRAADPPIPVFMPLPGTDRTREWNLVDIVPGTITTAPGEEPLVRAELRAELDNGGTQTTYHEAPIGLDRFSEHGEIDVNDLVSAVETHAAEQQQRIDEIQRSINETAPRVDDNQWRSLQDTLGAPAWSESMDVPGHVGENDVRVIGTDEVDGQRGVNVVMTDAVMGDSETFFVPVTPDNFVHGIYLDGASLTADIMNEARSRLGDNIEVTYRGDERMVQTDTGTEITDRYSPDRYDNAMRDAEQILQSALPETFSGDLRWSANSGDFRIEDPEGNNGKIQFEVSGDTLHVGLMQFDEEMQDRGLGTAMVGAVLSAAEQMNLSGIEFNANISVGGYAWARMGAYPTDTSWDTIRYGVNTRLAVAADNGVTVTDEQRAEIESLLAGPPQNITKIAELDDKIDLTPIAKRYDPNEPATANLVGGYAFNLDDNNKIELGKALLLGTSWDARIPIGDQSAREEFQQYTAEKQTVAAAAEPRRGIGAYVRRDGTLDDATFWSEVLGDETLARTASSRFARRAFVEYDESKHKRDLSGRFTFKTPEPDEEAGPSRPEPGVSAMWDRLPADQQQAVLDQAAKHRLDYEDMHARAGALLDAAKNAYPEAEEKGLGWYARMRDLADERAARSGVTREEYLALVAATSPRMQWDWENYPEDDPRKYPNLNAADLMARLWNDNPDLTVSQFTVDRALTTQDGKPAYAAKDLSEFLGETRPLREWSPDIAARILGTNRWLNNPDSAAHVMWPRAADALSVMHASAAGHDPADAINGPKTYAFDKTLLDPDYPGAVVDAWMIQALSGRQASSSGGANIAPGEIDVHVLDQPNTTPGPKTQYKEAWEPRGTVYTLASAAVEQAADERGMSTSDAQAVIWYVLRDTGFTYMPPNLMEAPVTPTDSAVG